MTFEELSVEHLRASLLACEHASTHDAKCYVPAMQQMPAVASPVPDAPTALLMLAGVAVLAWVRRGRK